MTNFETIMVFLVLGLTVGTGVVLYLALRTEAKLAARRKITLANYRQKNNLFYISSDYPTTVFAGAMAAATLGLGIAAVFTPMLRRYLIPLGLLLIVNGFSAYFSLSRRKFSRDIRIFDAYYVRVADLLANKERTQRDIGICQKRVSELRQKLNSTIDRFNSNFTAPLSADFVPELFAPVDRMLRDYTNEIERFSGAIEQDFNEALRVFLLEETEPQLHIMPLRTFDEVAADDLIAEIKSSYGERIAGLVIGQIGKGAVANARALGNVMTLLHELGVKVDNETLARFMRAAADFEDRAALAEILYANKQIPASLVCDVMIPEDWEWVFTPGMVASYNTRELTMILVALLAADRSAMCYLFLSQFDGSLGVVLESAIEAERTRVGDAPPNAAARQAEAFRLILCSDYAVGNTGSIFENLAMMLFDRRVELGLTEEEQVRVVQIVREERFLQSRRDIGVMYNKAVTESRPLFESATRVILQYVMNPPEDGSFLDPKRLVALLGEYRFTLSVGDLATLRALVAGWLLAACKEESVRAAVLHELEILQTGLPEGSPAELAAADPAAYGRAILAHLLQKDRVRLCSALYRTESKRLALDRVSALCRKGG